VVTHVVLIKPKPDAKPKQFDELKRQLAGLVDLIPGLKNVAWGPNTSPEGKGLGFDHGFIMEFGSATDRDIYLPPPAHRAVSPFIRAVADDVLVFDLES
jgi:hypothetical protein